MKCALVLTALLACLAAMARPGDHGTAAFPAAGALAFSENKGQIHTPDGQPLPAVLFQLSAGSLNISLEANAIHYLFLQAMTTAVGNKRQQGIPSTGSAGLFLPAADSILTYRLDVRLIGANPHPEIIAEEREDYFENYYLPGCGEHGITGVRRYKRIIYRDIYPNIDWVIYTTSGNREGLKYDFIVRPGGRASDIQLQYSGGRLEQNGDGSITAITPLGAIREAAPYAYIKETGRQQPCRFRVANDRLGFQVSPEAQQTLVIDPDLSWSAYYGGTGSDRGHSVACDPASHVYLAGSTSSLSNIATIGSYQSVLAASGDAFLAKFSPTGVRLWATYYGGPGGDGGYSVICPLPDAVYLTGATGSTTGIATPGSQQPVFGGTADVFLVKLNANGVRQWATYFGGPDQEIPAASGGGGNALASDKTGHVYLSGTTTSTSGVATPGSHQPAYGGGNYDAFLVKFDSLGARQWATYYGDTGDDRANMICADTFGHVYLGGWTNGENNIATPNSYQPHLDTSILAAVRFNDAFLVQFNSAGVRQWGTYFGGEGVELGKGAACDPQGNIYLCGSTSSLTSIATPGAHQTTLTGGGSFLAKFSSLGSRLWSTYFVGNAIVSAECVRADRFGNVFLGGYTNSTSGISTPGGPQVTNNGGIYDAFLEKFDPSGNRIWGTYYGGSDGDYMYAIASDTLGNVYTAGRTLSTTGIATQDAHQTVHGGGFHDAFLAKYIDTLGMIRQAADTLDYCQGDSVHIAFTTTGLFHAANVFTAQLSDAAGSFWSPTTLGTLTGATGGTLHGLLPPWASGAGFRIRIVSSFPVWISDTTVAIIAPSVAPAITITASDTTICSGTSVLFTAAGVNAGINPAYQWHRNNTPAGPNSAQWTTALLADGDEIVCKVIADASACIFPDTVSSSPVVMTVYALPQPQITRMGNVLGTGGYSSYQWYRDGIIITGATQQQYTLTQNGSYQVAVTDSNGCTSESTVFPVQDRTAVSGPDAFSDIRIYPNPVSDRLFVGSPVPVSVVICSMDGRVVVYASGTDVVDVSSLSGGVYLLSVYDPQGGRIKVERLVKMAR